MPGDTLTAHLDAFREAALSCPLPAAVELIGEKWAFLILRGALNGLKHFEEFQAGLGIARNILSDRLSKLVAGGILERAADPEDGRRVIYSLSAKGDLPIRSSINRSAAASPASAKSRWRKPSSPMNLFGLLVPAKPLLPPRPRKLTFISGASSINSSTKTLRDASESSMVVV